MNGGDDSNDDPAELQPEPQTPGQAMVRNVVAQFRRPDFKPPVLPATAIELLELSRKPDVTFAAVRVVVERDPVIVARVLQLAQSSYYARGAKVKTLHDAMLRLGLVTLGQVFFEASVASRLFRAQGYDNEMEMLRRHSVATGRIARILARRCSVPDENAFLAGILHDIGLAAAMIVIVSVPRGTVVPSFAEAFPLIVEAHTTIGEQLCRAWKLPDPVIAAVAGPHEARRGPAPRRPHRARPGPVRGARHRSGDAGGDHGRGEALHRRGVSARLRSIRGAAGTPSRSA